MPAHPVGILRRLGIGEQAVCGRIGRQGVEIGAGRHPGRLPDLRAGARLDLGHALGRFVSVQLQRADAERNDTVDERVIRVDHQGHGRGLADGQEKGFDRLGRNRAGRALEEDKADPVGPGFRRAPNRVRIRQSADLDPGQP